MEVRHLFKILLFLLVTTTGAAQQQLQRKITFACENCTIEEALIRLGSQQDLVFTYSNNLFEDCPNLQLKTQNQSIAYFLNKILDCNQLIFNVLNEQIVISKRNRKFRFSGFVKDAETGESLLGAVAKVLPDGKTGASSNEFGFFSLVLPEGKHQLYFSYIGYENLVMELNLSQNQNEVVYLKPKATLPEIVISASNFQQDSNRFSIGKRDLPIESLRKMTMPGGERDIVRLAALQPGVQTGVDGLGGLHIRGGNADQNLVLLDDVPVYNPSHALGLLSIFNASVVSQASLWKGNFPARFGGRASSVFDVRTREGNLKNYNGKISAGMLASSIEFEGPLRKDTSSFLLAGRMSYFDPWIKAFSRRKNLITIPNSNEVAYRFFDINAKFSQIYSEKTRFFASFYKGKDVFKDEFKQQFFYPTGTFEDLKSVNSTWGNTIASLRLNHLFNAKIFSNTTLTFSQFFYENRLAFSSKFFQIGGRIENLTDVGQLYRTFIQDFSARTDLTIFVNNKTTIRTGANFIRHFLQPGAVAVDLLQPGQTPASLDSLELLLANDDNRVALENEVYLETDWRFGWGFQLMAGLHSSLFVIQNTRFFAPQPRLYLQKNFRRGFSCFIGYHRMTQNLHQIGSFNISLPFELWVPSTQKVPPEQVWQASLGAAWQRGDWAVQVEGYFKRLDRVLNFQSAYHALFAGGAENASGWEDRIVAGEGWSRGAELFLEKRQGSTVGSVAYTLSWSWRRFDDLNSGQAFPFRFDRRHDLKIVLQQKITKQWSADATWAWASGNPITLAGVKFNHVSNEIPSSQTVLVYSNLNGYRLANYHRLDVGMTYEKKNKKFGHLVQFGVYNAYNRRNPFFVSVDAGSSVRGKATQYSLLPILPSLRYEFSF